MSCELSTPTCVVKCPKHLLTKLHVQPKPNCNFLYTNCKIGNSVSLQILFHSNFYHLFLSFQLWKTAQPNDFTFADPLMRETPTEYNSLHDPNLRTFFMRKARLDVSGICITNQPSKSLHLRSNLILSLNSICVATTSSRVVTRSFAR